MFRTHAIILSNQRIRDQFTRIVLFTKEFGKIHCWYKKWNIPDIATICEVTIEREKWFNSIKTFEKQIIPEALSPFQYHELIELLKILYILNITLPDSVEHRSIFDDIEMCLTCHFLSRDRSQFYLLIQARILKKLWYLDRERFEKTPLERYIYDNLDQSSIKNLSESKKFDENIRNTLTVSILESQHRITFHT